MCRPGEARQPGPSGSASTERAQPSGSVDAGGRDRETAGAVTVSGRAWPRGHGHAGGSIRGVKGHAGVGPRTVDGPVVTWPIHGCCDLGAAPLSPRF